VIAVLLGLTAAQMTANAIPPTRASSLSGAISPNDLKPTECDVISVTSLVTGQGTVGGTAAADLILGSSLIDTVSGGGGTDCIVGGGLGDTLQGDAADDVLVGGPGADLLNGGAGFDRCYGGEEVDVFLSCEVQVQ
jgi:Ca2+-binding RTX toxin-like protein